MHYHRDDGTAESNKFLDSFRDEFFPSDVVVTSFRENKGRVFFEVSQGSISLPQLANVARRLKVATADFVIHYETVGTDVIVWHGTLIPVDEVVFANFVQSIMKKSWTQAVGS